MFLLLLLLLLLPLPRLVVRPDNTFEISIDHTLVNHGTLLDSFTPPVNPPAEIDDPEDKWVSWRLLLDDCIVANKPLILRGCPLIRVF